MAKLYFKYGAMGSSKSAQALITQFNYEEMGMSVWLIKPVWMTATARTLSRAAWACSAAPTSFFPATTSAPAYEAAGHRDVVIADEAQFFTPAQIDGLREMVDDLDLPVLCFGLRTDFLTHMFPGSQRLMELADSITEIKTICECGSKATVTARLAPDGKIITAGEQVFLGGNDSYIAMCHKCWRRKIREQQGK